MKFAMNALAMLAIAAFQIQTCEPVETPSPILVNALRSCLAAQTARLERSGERPTDVAVAVDRACNKAIAANVNEGSQCRGWRAKKLLNEKLRAGIREDVISQVVEIRSKKRR